MKLAPILATERKSLIKTVIQAIKKYIIDNKLKHGDKLPTERKLAEMFGVSRSVIREALSYLENTEVITTTQGKGAFLNETNIGHLLSNFFFLWKVNGGRAEDILSLRILFETSAIDVIINHQRVDELKTLRKKVEDSKKLKTIEEFGELDGQFHKQLLMATNNHLFIQMTHMITTYFFETKDIQLTKEEYKNAIDEHEEIVHYLESGDAEEAKKLLSKHIQHTKV